MTATTTIDKTAHLGSLRPSPDQEERWLIQTQPIPLAEAIQLVLAAQADDGDRRDVVVHDLRAWAFGSEDGQTMQLAPVPLPGRRLKTAMQVRELAFTQLCQRIGAPASYIRDLPPKLQMANMNWGMAHESRTALLRLAGSEVRAIVSDRYAKLDDSFILEVVDEVLRRAGIIADARVRAVGLGHHTVLRITLPGEGVAVRAGDVIEAGIDVANSEVGLRSVQITPITYRLVCSNGMRAWRSEATLRMRHVGDPERLRDQIRDAVPIAFAEARGDIARWQRATEVLIDNALDEVESLRLIGLTTGEVHAVGRQIAEAAGRQASQGTGLGLDAILAMPTSAYDVANGITAVARARDSVGSRLSLEEVAHRYLLRRTE